MDHAGRVNGFMTTGKRVVMEGDSLPDLFIGASWKDTQERFRSTSRA